MLAAQVEKPADDDEESVVAFGSIPCDTSNRDEAAPSPAAKSFSGWAAVVAKGSAASNPPKQTTEKDSAAAVDREVDAPILSLHPCS